MHQKLQGRSQADNDDRIGGGVGDNSNNEETEDEAIMDPTEEKRRRKKRVLVKLDDTCLVVFPIIFGIFNVLYWTLCLNHSPNPNALNFHPATNSDVLFD